MSIVMAAELWEGSATLTGLVFRIRGGAEQSKKFGLADLRLEDIQETFALEDYTLAEYRFG